MTTHTKLSHFRELARHSLKGKWVFVAELTLLFFIVTILIQSSGKYLFFLPMILLPLIGYGYSLSMLRLTRGQVVTFETLFAGFSQRFGTIFFAYLVTTIRTILWSLLFIIPGIIAAYSYSQTFFILADKENIGALEAIEESKKRMKGNKWRLFLLGLSFIGWGILAIFTLGIGYIWLYPYIVSANAKFYDSIKG